VKAIAERATRRRKALRSVEATSFDEGVGEAVLAAAAGFGPDGVATGSVRGSFFLLACGRKRRREGAPSEGSLDRGCHQEQPALAPSSEDEGRVVELAEAGSATSTSAATRVVRWGFGSSGRDGGRE
jgi:hypothetical protein